MIINDLKDHDSGYHSIDTSLFTGWSNVEKLCHARNLVIRKQVMSALFDDEYEEVKDCITITSPDAWGAVIIHQMTEGRDIYHVHTEWVWNRHSRQDESQEKWDIHFHEDELSQNFHISDLDSYDVSMSVVGIIATLLSTR